MSYCMNAPPFLIGEMQHHCRASMCSIHKMACSTKEIRFNAASKTHSTKTMSARLFSLKSKQDSGTSDCFRCWIRRFCSLPYASVSWVIISRAKYVEHRWCLVCLLSLHHWSFFYQNALIFGVQQRILISSSSRSGDCDEVELDLYTETFLNHDCFITLQ